MNIPDFCKSCGLPLVDGKLSHGTNVDGSKNDSYCEFCYKNGVLTTKDMNKEQIIERSTSVYIERFGWKNQKNAKKEAASSLRMATEMAGSGRKIGPLSMKIKLLLLAFFAGALLFSKVIAAWLR